MANPRPKHGRNGEPARCRSATPCATPTHHQPKRRTSGQATAAFGCGGDEGDAQALSLTLVKRQADEPETPPHTTPPTPIRYRDGIGRALPDADLGLSEAAFVALMRRLSHTMHGRLNSRSGPVVCEETLPQPRRIRFTHRPGSRPWRWVPAVPAPERWAAGTGLEPDERHEVLRDMADQLLNRLPGWEASVRDEIIDFLERKPQRP